MIIYHLTAAGAGAQHSCNFNGSSYVVTPELGTLDNIFPEISFWFLFFLYFFKSILSDYVLKAPRGKENHVKEILRRSKKRKEI